MLCNTEESHSLAKYFKKEEEKDTQAKCKVQVSAVPRDCCLGLKQEYYLLIIQFINYFTFLMKAFLMKAVLLPHEIAQVTVRGVFCYPMRKPHLV